MIFFTVLIQPKNLEINLLLNLFQYQLALEVYFVNIKKTHDFLHAHHFNKCLAIFKKISYEIRQDALCFSWKLDVNVVWNQDEIRRINHRYKTDIQYSK